MERRTFQLASTEGRRLQDVPGCVVFPRGGTIEAGADCFALVGVRPTEAQATVQGDGLKPHQCENAEFALRHGGALIGDPPGGGKSRSALEVARKCHGPLLVMGPAVARGTWMVESKRWLDTSVLALRGQASSSSFEAFNASFSDSKIVFVNYEVARYWGPALGAIPWGCVILDEVHRAKARRNTWVNGVAEATWQNVGPVVALSATPVWEGVGDLWRILSWVHPGIFGNYWDFARRYCGAFETRFGWKLGAPTNQDELRTRLGFCYIRHEGATATPVSRGLVLLDDATVRATLAAGALKLATLVEKGGDVRAATLALLSKATSVKIKALPQMLDERPTLIACHTRAATHAAAEACSAAGFRVWEINGDMPLEQRQALFFDAAAPVVVATRDSVRESIDGRRFGRLIVVDLAYVPDELVQLEGRLTRGQSDPVRIDYVIIEESFDSELLAVLLKRLDARAAALGESAQYRAVASVLKNDSADAARLYDLAHRIMEQAE